MADKPTNWKMPEGNYAGDVSAKVAWTILEANPQALLIDIRTDVEWKIIGQPDLSSIKKEPIYLQWVKMSGFQL